MLIKRHRGKVRGFEFENNDGVDLCNVFIPMNRTRLHGGMDRKRNRVVTSRTLRTPAPKQTKRLATGRGDASKWQGSIVLTECAYLATTVRVALPPLVLLTVIFPGFVAKLSSTRNRPPPSFVRVPMVAFVDVT
jgi:hypothetical protein